MTTQASSTQAQNTQPTDSEQAEKLRRVLSVKDPVKTQDKTAAATPKSPAR